MTSFQTPARAARRKLLRDRLAELLTEWGSDHAEERALELLRVVDDLGFGLPAAIDDVPDQRSRPTADPEHQAACMAEIREVFDRRRPAYGGSA